MSVEPEQFDEMPPFLLWLPYSQAAFVLKVGEISPPFRSPYGVHLLTVSERVEGQLSLEDARPEILQVLSAEMQRDVLSRERAQAKIERP